MKGKHWFTNFIIYNIWLELEILMKNEHLFLLGGGKIVLLKTDL